MDMLSAMQHTVIISSALVHVTQDTDIHEACPCKSTESLLVCALMMGLVSLKASHSN